MSEEITEEEAYNLYCEIQKEMFMKPLSFEDWKKLNKLLSQKNGR